MSELVLAGVATLEMLTSVKSGFDAAGDHYTTDAHWSVSGPGLPQRYRIWRKIKRVRALSMPGVHEALAHMAAQARRNRATESVPQQRHDQRHR